ncbi:hypothetical protein INR49_011142 [Caranx melampygus]|nr:hypothetical protein INR49_011142 [Caranx melampygus]
MSHTLTRSTRPHQVKYEGASLLLPPLPGYPSAQMGPAVSQQPYPGNYTIIQPSVVVVGGCPACRANADLRFVYFHSEQEKLLDGEGKAELHVLGR